MNFTQEDLERVKAQGFDQSVFDDFSRISVRCSQCDARVINSVPTHEHGCPNAARARDMKEEDG